MEDVKKGVQLKHVCAVAYVTPLTSSHCCLVHLQADTSVDAGDSGVKVSDFDLFLMGIAKFDKNSLSKVEASLAQHQLTMPHSCLLLQLDDSGKPTCNHPRQLNIPQIKESLLLEPRSTTNVGHN